MDSLALQFTIERLVPWIIFSGLVYSTTAYFTRQRNTSTGVWWLSLLASFLPLLPVSYASVVATPLNVNWINTSIENVQMIKHATIAHAGLNDMDYLVALLAITYAGIALYKLIKLALNWWRLKRLVGETAPLAVKAPSKIKVVASKFNHSPFVFGVFKPLVVLPQYFSSMSESRQRILIQHELTHIAFKDPVAVIIWRVLSALFWINPLVGKMEWQFVRAMEHRCDRHTIARYGMSKFEYAQTLVQSLRKAAVTYASPVAQFNSTALDADDYKQRLTHIVDGEKSTNITMVLGVCLTIGSLTGAVLSLNLLSGSEAPKWQHPLTDYRVSSPYNNVSKIRFYKPHKGVDYVAPIGSPITAAAYGVVIVADGQTLHPNFGNAVLIQHKGGYQTLYAHLASISVKPGDWISAGQRIGVIGDTGRTTGIHLHFEVMRDQQRLDPDTVLPKM